MGPLNKISIGRSLKTTIKDDLSRGKSILIAPITTAPITISDVTSSPTNSSLSNSLIGYSKHREHHYYKNHPYSHSRSNSHSNSRDGTNQNNSNVVGNGNGKRTKRNSWGARERAGMSFLIVIAFFAVFGLIIITELFMIDDKNHGGIVVLRHGNLNSRLGDSMPDYDNVKEDYESIDANFLLGDTNRMIQYRDSKIKLQDHLSVGISMAINSLTDNGDNKNVNNYLKPIPFGQRLDTRIEETLPHYQIGTIPTDGIWQVVNGTRFKFFVYSAYYDKRDGRIIRVIGATKTRAPEKVWCRLWYSYKDLKNNNRTKYYSATVTGRVKIIRENWNLKYSACFVICPLKAPGLEITPQSVSIVSRLRAPPGNVLLIRNTDENIKKLNNNHNDKIGICVKPFHFNYDHALYLIEYIELNTLLGISHFTFYNHTLGSHSSCVLKHYVNGDIPDNLTTAFDINNNSNNNLENFSSLSSIMDNDIGNNFDTINLYKYKDNIKNNYTNSSNPNIITTIPSPTNRRKTKFYKKRKLYLDTSSSSLSSSQSQYVKPSVNILPWDLKMRSQKEIRTEGLFAALNDCLYRNMYNYKYLTLIDLDEFIVPRHNKTILELLSWLNNRYTNRNAGSYSFQNAFFYLQFPDDLLIYDEKTSENAPLRASLVTQRKTKRRSKLHPQKQRSKYICKPEAVVEAGNHFVWEFLPGKGSLNVPADAGILHHYRICEFGGDDCIKSPSIVDRTATKYMKELVNRVNNVYNYLKKPCNLDNIPPIPTRPSTTATPKVLKKSLKKPATKFDEKISKTNMKINQSRDGGSDGVVKVNVKQLI